ncbi:hypothetical protein [uncultured Brachyspira sp.]|uniref:hypothetical protein n=1 Tax=uncultured Brachyspira sp. TaxID=221953 RepID=UPI002637CC06|nr:hypothetical protein [uncultured Brachyspira sp.]
MSILNDYKECKFIAPDKNEMTLILENTSNTFKRKVQSGTVNNVTYAQDEGKDTTQITLDVVFFDYQAKGSEALEILKKKMENYNADIKTDYSNCYEQASYFMGLVSQKASDDKPAYLQHPLYPNKLKVCTVSVKDNTSLIKDVGMSKVSVTFILVDKYGIPPSGSVNKSSIGGQFFNVLRPMLDAICKKGAEEYSIVNASPEAIIIEEKK